MDIEGYVSSVLDGTIPPLPSATSDSIQSLVDQLKAEADRQWSIDARNSLRCGDAIIAIGESVCDVRIIALGTMVLGDALKLLNRMEEAWQLLDKAGELYQSAGDEVGWARTRIGKLAICVQLNRVDEAMVDADLARHILAQHDAQQRLLALEMNAALAYDLLGDFRTSIGLYRKALNIARTEDTVGSNYLGMLYLNLGYAHYGLGELREALGQYQQSRDIWEAQGDSIGIAMAKLNIAQVAYAQGHYRNALKSLHEVLEPLRERYPSEAVLAQRDLIECYLLLNRFADARDLALRLIAETPVGYVRAITLIQLAIAEARLGDFQAALTALNDAEPILNNLGADGWLAILRLRRAQIAQMRGDLARAYSEVALAKVYFEAHGQRGQYALTLLLQGHLLLADGHLQAARENGKRVHEIGLENRDPSLSYSAHLLLAKAAESEGLLRRAVRHYQAAAATITRVQRRLILTFHPDFLADKQDAWHALLRIYLTQGQPRQAFEILERVKSQVWLTYLNQKDQLRWLNSDPTTQAMLEELNRLREEHHWHFRVAYDAAFRERQHSSIALEEASQEAARREHRMRAVTEQLYLHSTQKDTAHTPAVTTAEIQTHLTASTLMIAYFNDGQHLWAFTLDHDSIEVHKLPVEAAKLDQMLDKLQTNIRRALRTSAFSNEANTLESYLRQISGRLYEALLEPLAARMMGRERLIIVPYGSLHYLPFHILHNRESYLIEHYSMVVLPTASLIGRRTPKQARGALALAHSWDGRLPHTSNEAAEVVKRLGGEVYVESEARRSTLGAPPRQVLHIAAHGHYRIDQPDFSHIQLADGPLYTDDLFQHDLSYELVTLSACETGRSRAAAGDELIGLGRGFLFAGAGAVIASLWPVSDALTQELMGALYHQLDTGASTAAALRAAQRTLLTKMPGLHPAFWGAFELIGSDQPLSGH